jgi:putative sugar O-methyltransferase
MSEYGTKNKSLIDLAQEVGSKSRLLRKVQDRAQLAIGRVRRLFDLGPNKSDVNDYKLMKSDNTASNNLYRAGQFWERLNRRHADAIWGGGLTDLRNGYINRSFASPDPASRQVYRALLHLYYKYIQEIDTDHFLTEIGDFTTGRETDQETLFGKPCSLDFLQSVEEAYRIRKSWALSERDGEPNVIVEIGAGYGRLAYVCKNMLPNCTYIIFDLPEALICAQSWLSQALPDAVVPFTETRGLTNISWETLEKGKIYLFVPHKIEAISNDFADAFVNIYSFAEMPAESIKNYFHHIDRITDGVFYMKQRELEKNVFDNVDLDEHGYPAGEEWNVLFRNTSSLYDNFFEKGFSTRRF